MGPVLRHCPCLRPENDDIRILDYSHSNLDDVPSEVFGFERTLEELYLDANQIKDLPRPLFHCHGLRKLNLSDNEIQCFPPAIASLINLEELDVSKNGILEIPDNIKGCKCLSVVEASVNPLGKLPEGFTQLINLEELYLNDTFLEYLPANFGRLSRLRILELRENHLKVLPKSMARLTQLNRLDIGQNGFVDLPEVIGSLPKLVELWCDCNNLTSLPLFLGGLKKLAYLDASKNKIYEVAEEVEGCTNLCDLTLSGNRIKELPDGVGNLKKLTVLRIDENRLISLPSNIGNLVHLEELAINCNDIERLPSSIGLLRNLHTLIADDNVLEELPVEVGSCAKLSILSLRDNKLAFIPDELGHAVSLKVINFSGNLLQFLPFSIAKLPNLQALWLSENQNKPLVPLQSDTNQETGQKVLTCFMLPQVPLEEESQEEVDHHKTGAEEGKEERHQIKFAFDTELEQPGRLVRAPTPYPKELKAHARHARNYALKKQGSKDSECGELGKDEKHSTESNSVSDKSPEVLPDTDFPEGMVLAVGASEVRVKVKEAKVTKPKSPVSSPRLGDRRYVLKAGKEVLDSALELPTNEASSKVLGRRDSRGDCSSSEKSSVSPACSPQLTPDGNSSAQSTISSHSKSTSRASDGKEVRFKKNTVGTSSKRDGLLRHRLLRQGSGDSDRGYRSDHELYVTERDQWEQLYGQHDGYASDWEAFIAKQALGTGPWPVPMVHQYTRTPSSGEIEYRGRAEEHANVPGGDDRNYWRVEKHLFPDGMGDRGIDGSVEERCHMQPGYWPHESSPPISYSRQEDHYYTSVQDERSYYGPRITKIEVIQPPSNPSLALSADGPRYPPPPYPCPQPHRGIPSPSTVPKRMASSPRLKRPHIHPPAVPIHSLPSRLSPHEYQPQQPVPSSPPVHHLPSGSAQWPGRSPSPRMLPPSHPVPHQPYPIPPTHGTQSQPNFVGHSYPITAQPMNSGGLVPPHHSYPGNPPTFPIPTSPRLKHPVQTYASSSGNAAVSQTYNSICSVVHPPGYYPPQAKSPNDQWETPSGPSIIRCSPTLLRKAQYCYDSQDVSKNSSQYASGTIPSIHVVPSNVSTQHYHLSASSDNTGYHNESEWKETSPDESGRGQPDCQHPRQRPLSVGDTPAQPSPSLHHSQSSSSINSCYLSSGSEKQASVRSSISHPSSRPSSSSSLTSVSAEGAHSVPQQSVTLPQDATNPNHSIVTETRKIHFVPLHNANNGHSSVKVSSHQVINEKCKNFCEIDQNAVIQPSVSNYKCTETISENVNSINVQNKKLSNENIHQVLHSKSASDHINKDVSREKNPDSITSKKNSSLSNHVMLEKTISSSVLSHQESVNKLPSSSEMTDNCAYQVVLSNNSIHKNLLIKDAVSSKQDKPSSERHSFKKKDKVDTSQKLLPSANLNSCQGHLKNRHLNSAGKSHKEIECNRVEECSVKLASNNTIGKYDTLQNGSDSISEVQRQTTTFGKSVKCKENSVQQTLLCGIINAQKTAIYGNKNTSQLALDKDVSHGRPDGRATNSPPLLPPKPTSKHTLSIGHDQSKQTKIPPAVPPKPFSLAHNHVNGLLHGSRQTQNLGHISVGSVTSSIAQKQQQLLDAHNTNSSSIILSDPNLKRPDSLCNAVPDLLNSENVKMANAEHSRSHMHKNKHEEAHQESNQISLLDPSELMVPDKENNLPTGVEDKCQESPKSPKKSWFFGAHKNPLVFPVVVLKNPGLGFSIEGGIGSPKNPDKPSDTGIYVAHVVTNGPASTALKPGDKILQVDGIDFTRLDHSKASAVLQDSGPTLSMMVSRD